MLHLKFFLTYYLDRSALDNQPHWYPLVDVSLSDSETSAIAIAAADDDVDHSAPSSTRFGRRPRGGARSGSPSDDTMSESSTTTRHSKSADSLLSGVKRGARQQRPSQGAAGRLRGDPDGSPVVNADQVHRGSASGPDDDVSPKK